MTLDTGRCRSCGAIVRWGRSVRTGKAMPLDPSPSDGAGNVKVLTEEEKASAGYASGDGNLIVFGAEEAKARRDAGEALYLSHFATCPNAARHRTGGRR